MPRRILTQRALNRAFLERQLLLQRSGLDVVGAVEHLIGLQAQAPKAPYVGLWTRLTTFEAADLERALLERRVVRLPLMRSTIHLVSAEDCLRMRRVTQPAMDRDLAGSRWGKGVVGVDFGALENETQRVLEQGPLVAADLGRELAKRWRKRDPGSLAYAARNTMALVQIPPRGLWVRSGRPLLSPAESWLGKRLEESTSPHDMIVRYLRAFGPAAVRDMQTWSGLTGLGPVVDELRPRLEAYEDESGRELFDVPDGALPDPGTPAPVRFLPEFDNLLLAHADRTRVIPPEFRDRVVRNLGVKKTFLVDGFVAGEWKAERRRNVAILIIAAFRRHPKKVREDIEREGRRLLAFLEPAAASQEVRIEVAT